MQRIEFKDVVVRYRETLALRSVSVAVEPGEFLALLGPSGCGKTTLLRVISGFVPYQGHVLFDGKPVDSLPAHKREIGIVFQDYALFPHKTVRENIGFGLRMRNAPAARIRSRVDEMIALLQLDGLADRYPSQLSGGQQQRVALARAIAIEPRVLLLDEPLGALDKKLREEMQVELRQLQKRLGITTIFVTHDQEEALSLADRIAVMRDGQVHQIGPTAELYERPTSRFVAEFMGQSNILEGRVEACTDGHARCRLRQGGLVTIAAKPDMRRGDSVLLSIRPERLRVGPPLADDGAAPGFAGAVEHATYLGGFMQLRVKLASGEVLKAVLQNKDGAVAALVPGAQVHAGFEPRDVVLLAE